MVFRDFRKFLLRELIFPKTLIVDKPGIVANKTVRRFGRGSVKTRTGYYFEEIYASLYVDSLKRFGEEQTRELWYKIGKEAALRYFSFMGTKFNGKVSDLILDYCFSAIKSTGFSFAGEFVYDVAGKTLEVRGLESVICRKSGHGDLVAGIVAGIMSYFHGENFEAEVFCDKCPSCKVVSNMDLKRRCLVDIGEVSPMKNYLLSNFLEGDSVGRVSSFGDFVKFEKIRMDPVKSKFYFRNKAVLTSEVGLGELFLKNYVEIGERDFFEESVLKSSKKLFLDLSVGQMDKMKFLSSLISAFGWGVPYFRKKDGVIVLSLFNPARTRFGVSHLQIVICGFLRAIYGDGVRIVRATDSEVVFEF